MRMRSAIVIVLVGIASVLGFWLISIGGPERLRANRIISRIEDYRHRAGNLPDPADDSLMKALGFELSVDWDPDYQRLDATNYRITIFRGFDGPYWFYESKSNRWIHGMPPPRRRADDPANRR